MMTTYEIEIGDKVQAGQGDEHDTGRVLAIGFDDTRPAHPMNRAGCAWIGWDSGVQTWAEVADLSPA